VPKTRNQFNYKAFQGITRKIERDYPRDNYACNTLAIVSAEMLFTPRHAECLLNHRGHSAPGPELPPEAVGFWATLEEAGQLSQLFGS
jgi:hypothetical protein